MNIYNNYSPQRSPPFEKIFARVKPRGSGFRHPYPLCKKTRPLYKYFKRAKGRTIQNNRFQTLQAYRFRSFFLVNVRLCFGFGLVILWFSFGYCSVIRIGLQ
jgi:hypothetical protein